ncbi:odorant receptor 94b-like [Bradysia coprophila]|uniref:odorant receptor 94b-like n=1 Tax=Bradysia coprophila TaxID=38358 RepID=UPI00187D85BD|nr:odorant receptor 94b-like [Bradysia coprophila]
MAISFNFISAIMSDNPRLPYPAWYPFGWKSNTSAYPWLYTYQVVGVIIQANLNMSLDLLAAYFMFMASIKLEIVGNRLQKLGEMKQRGEKRVQSDSRYVQGLQKCFSCGLIIQITFSGAVICSTAYQLTTISPQENLGFYSSLIMYQLCMVGQVFIPCHFGNEIILKHEIISGSIFDSELNRGPLDREPTIFLMLQYSSVG